MTCRALTRSCTAVLMALALTGLPGQALAGAVLEISAEDTAPDSFASRGAVVGSTTDLLKAALARADVPYSLTLYPWKRAFRNAAERANSCVYVTVRNEEREPLFKWVGPLVQDYWVILASRARTPAIAVSALEDLKNYRVGVALGAAFTGFFDRHELPYEEIATAALGAKMLHEGRIDLWATSRSNAAYLARSNHYDDLVEVLPVQSVDGYMACNRAVGDDIIARLNHALTAIAADGTRDKILSRYR